MKKFLDFESQLELLKSRKLLIPSDEVALHVLRNHNYYRLNGYFHQYFKAENEFDPSANFQTIYEAYDTDRKLRRVLTEYLEEIEIATRCQVAYWLAAYKKDGGAFYDASLFKDDKELDALQERFRKATTRDALDPVADHYYTAYDGKFEIWVVVEYLSFGELSRLFGITDTRIQAQIASHFRVHETLLKSWLECLSILRNICAHYGYLRNRIFATFPAIPKPIQRSVEKSQKLYMHMIAISWLLNDERRTEFIDSIDALRLDRASYGFPDDWKKNLIP